METGIATTPFGRRPMSLAIVAARSEVHRMPKGRAVDKWQVYRSLCEGKSIVGVGDRALAVLNALLSFYPDSELSEENGLVVFPSNAQLSLRAHGMADATLRRHLAALVGCGLIIRRDSPNGKRYARKGRGGDQRRRLASRWRRCLPGSMSSLPPPSRCGPTTGASGSCARGLPCTAGTFKRRSSSALTRA